MPWNFNAFLIHRRKGSTTLTVGMLVLASKGDYFEGDNKDLY